jgi:hypothetical protein
MIVSNSKSNFIAVFKTQLEYGYPMAYVQLYCRSYGDRFEECGTLQFQYNKRNCSSFALRYIADCKDFETITASSKVMQVLAKLRLKNADYRPTMQVLNVLTKLKAEFGIYEDFELKIDPNCKLAYKDLCERINQ